MQGTRDSSDIPVRTFDIDTPPDVATGLAEQCFAVRKAVRGFKSAGSEQAVAEEITGLDGVARVDDGWRREHGVILGLFCRLRDRRGVILGAELPILIDFEVGGLGRVGGPDEGGSPGGLGLAAVDWDGGVGLLMMRKAR